MYVRTETRVYETARLDWTEVVTCPHCGARWKGGVISRGYGSEQTWHGMGKDSGMENAGIDAFSRAVDAGKQALLRARCPRCHKRGGGVASLVVKVVLLYGFLGALLTWVAREMGHGGMWDGGSSRFLLPIIIVLVLVLIPVTVMSSLGRVDRCVRYVPLEEIGPQPGPPPAAPRPRPAPAAPAPRAPDDPDALELDTDRSWNKRG